MIQVFSPAKLNLFFRVLKKREDGYHEVASIYSAIDFGDTISVAKSDQDRFTSSEPSLLTDPTNSVLKALALFREASNCRAPVAIDLEKKIPFGSGMGGGSSNAASTLFALNTLFNFPLHLDQLIGLGRKIGSDVPFFFSKGLAYCTGRGEYFTDLDLAFPSPFWIAIPIGLSSSTPKVYQNCVPGEVSTESPFSIVKSFLKNSPCYFNDLEPAAMRVNPELKELKQKLIDLGMPPLAMTGSGSTFFGQGSSPFPKDPHFHFYSVNACLRNSHQWY